MSENKAAAQSLLAPHQSPYGIRIELRILRMVNKTFQALNPFLCFEALYVKASQTRVTHRRKGRTIPDN